MEQFRRSDSDASILRAELAARLDEIEGLRRDLDRQRRELETATQALAAMRRRVDGLLNSKSWTITRPLRALYGLILGRRSSGRTDERAGTLHRLDWGALARVTPVSSVWGIDRGLPVDRHYIHRFLDAHRQDIRGRVLEIKDSHYAKTFGAPNVTSIDVLDANPANAEATIIADLTKADNVRSEGFDCFILTQTLHIIYDIRSAVANAMRMLAPGGVLLCTIPAVSRINYEDGGLESGDYWRMTAAAVKRLFLEFADEDALNIETSGNVQVCAAFLYGVATEELDADVLSYNDPWFPLVHCIRAVREIRADSEP